MDISIITTTFNRKELLRETIESAQKSIFAPLEAAWEHIICDDASTDGTEELFANNPWPNVRYMKSKENKGPSHGKNAAIAVAKGKYILVLDSDDILLERTLYYFLKASHENPGTDWFVSDFLRADKDLRYLPDDYYGWDFKTAEEMLAAIFKGEHFIQGNAFFTKEIFDAAKGFDESMHMGEDIDLYIRFLLRGSLPKHLPFQSHLHRMHGSNLSKNETLERYKLFAAELKEKYAKQS